MQAMRKLLSVMIMSVSLLLSGMQVHAEEELITIGTKQEFLNFMRQCTYDAWSLGKEFELTADINLAGEEFNGAPVFAGTLHGGGHTISGITLESEQSPAGLFGIVTKDGLIDGLRVSATVTPHGSQVSIGGIAGINYGILRSCTFMGTVKGARNTGGIAGINAASGMILNCSSSGVVYGQAMTGGIAGYNLGTITGSENSAYVNTDSETEDLNLSSISFHVTPDTDSLLASESGVVRIDMGGIAGYSDGSILLCRNQGTIGYPQIGYNVGGIAGRSDGHIQNCSNHAGVYGRKDVGGITGQAEPYVTTNLSASTIAALSSELSVLQSGVDALENHARETETDLQNRIDSMSSYMDTARSALDDLANYDFEPSEQIDTEQVESRIREFESMDFQEIADSIDTDEIRSRTEAVRDQAYDRISALQQIELKNAGSDLLSSVTGLSDQASVLRQELSGRADALVYDANQITSSITSIETTLNDALYTLQHPQDLIQDTSSSDVEATILGKVASCTNHGEVSGALNVGGIAGAMGIEYADDPEEDISGQLDASSKRQYELKCILEKNVNQGSVKGVRNDIGGIAGRMDLGLVLYCESYGDVASTSGDEVGGIVGITASTVRTSYAKCRLSGASSVGGIAGAGTDGTVSGASSILDGNISMVEITEAEQAYGAIGGSDTGTFTNNVFVSDVLGGINGASFISRAEPIAYADLLEQYAVPEAFRHFTLKFAADEEVLKEIEFDYGASLTAEDMPEIPAKEGMYAYYDRTDLTNLTGDTVVTAVYEEDLTSICAEDTRANGRSIFYVKGRFDHNAALKVTQQPHDKDSFELVSQSFWPAVLSYLKAPGKGLAYDLLEQWHIEIPQDGSDTHELRYLLPQTRTNTYQFYLRTDGGWKRITPQEIGNYAVFEAEGTETDLAVITAIPGWWIYALLGNAVLIIVLIIAMHASKEKRRKTHQAIRHKIAADRRFRIAIGAACALALVVLGTGIWILHSFTAGGLKAYQLIRDYTDSRPLAMEGSLELKLGSQVKEENFQLCQDESGVTVITIEDLPLYYRDETVCLENGRAFQVGSLVPDYGDLLELTAGVYEHGSVTVRTEDDATIYGLTASQEDAEALLKILLASYADELPDLKSINVELTERSGSLNTIELHAAGVLKDSDKTAYDVQVVLTARDANTVELTIPDAVKTALEEGSSDDTVLSRDYIDLLTGVAELRRSDAMSARVRLSADTDLLNLNDTIQYRRSYNGGKPIRSIQKGDRIVYFNDEKLCTETGLTVTDPLLQKLADTGKLPSIIYSICMNGTFDVSAAGDTRVFTISLDTDALDQMKQAIFAGHEELDPALDSGTLLITLNGTSITRVNGTLTGSASVLEETIPLTVGIDAAIGTDSSYQVPDSVLHALED